MNSLPKPAPSLLASMLPECIRTSFSTSVRPIPSPPSLRSSDRSPCVNRSKIRGSRSGVMPRPVSRTRSTAQSLSRTARPETVPPGAVNFTALFSKFEKNCVVGRMVLRPEKTSLAEEKDIENRQNGHERDELGETTRLDAPTGLRGGQCEYHGRDNHVAHAIAEEPNTPQRSELLPRLHAGQAEACHADGGAHCGAGYCAEKDESQNISESLHRETKPNNPIQKIGSGQSLERVTGGNAQRRKHRGVCRDIGDK